MKKTAPTRDDAGAIAESTRTPSVGLSLPECAERLRQEPGLRVPALITLKRWSARGDLNQARVGEGGARARYDYAKVLQLALDMQETALKRSPLSPAAPSAAISSTAAAGDGNPPRPASSASASASAGEASDTSEVVTSPADTPSAEELAHATAQALLPLLEPMLKKALGEVQRQLVEGLANLEATRRVLMLKYDAELHSLKDRVNELQALNATLRAAASPIDAARLQVLMSQVQAMLVRVQEHLEER